MAISQALANALLLASGHITWSTQEQSDSFNAAVDAEVATSSTVVESDVTQGS